MAALTFLKRFQSGFRLFNGDDLNNALANPILSSQDAITAGAGGTQANGFQLAAAINRVSVVTSANDSLLLPASQPGAVVTVINDGAGNSMQVFGLGTDTINDVLFSTGVAVASGKTATYFCPVIGKWYQNISA